MMLEGGTWKSYVLCIYIQGQVLYVCICLIMRRDAGCSIVYVGSNGLPYVASITCGVCMRVCARDQCTLRPCHLTHSLTYSLAS